MKVSVDYVDICYSPIIQSGGKYDIKVSALSNDDVMSADVIICSLGAKYRAYCATISRTFMVDAPKKVEQTYGILLALYTACLEQMIPGNEFKDVYKTAKEFLTKKDASLLTYLPKTLGFVIGLEFRDGTLVLNEKNATKFTSDMILNLSVGFQNIPIEKQTQSKSSSMTPSQKLTVFSLLIADVVRVQSEGVPEILTKVSKDFSDVSYSISGDKVSSLRNIKDDSSTIMYNTH